MPILVEYENVDGWYIFSSNDLIGLYVASKQLEVALNDVAPAIEKLVLLNSVSNRTFNL